MRAKRYAIGLTALMLGLATLAGAGSAAPANPDVGARLTSAGTTAGPSQPPNLPRIVDTEFAQELGVDEVTQVVTKQKLKIKLPQQDFLTYANTCYDLPAGSFGSDEFFGSFGRFAGFTDTCPQAYVDALQHAGTLLPAEAWPNGMVGINGKSWIQSPPGSERPFGTFPSVQVHTVAFGSVPITATVHISQAMRGGLIQPLSLQWIATTNYVDAGVVIPGYGAAPGYPYVFQFPPKFDGPVDIRLSDVNVDGVPLPVGDNCVAPADLTMNPAPGYYSIDYVNSPPTKGEPGEFAPLSPYLNYLPGNADIKAFSGCRQGSEDLDPLLTGMISGPGNPVEATVVHTLGLWCQTGDAGPPIGNLPPIGRVYCDLNQTPPEGQSATALRAMGLAATKQLTSGATKLSAADVQRLRKMDTKGMAPEFRKLWDQLVKALPPEARPGGK